MVILQAERPAMHQMLSTFVGYWKCLPIFEQTVIFKRRWVGKIGNSTKEQIINTENDALAPK